jgi:hypothetical protein
VASIASPGKVAIPLTSGCETVPVSLPPPGLETSARVIVSAALATGFPPASVAATRTAGARAVAGAALVGSVTKTSWLRGPAVIAKGVLGALVRPPPEAVSV